MVTDRTAGLLSGSEGVRNSDIYVPFCKCVFVVCMCLCVCVACIDVCEGQRRVLYTSELELQVCACHMAK